MWDEGRVQNGRIVELKILFAVLVVTLSPTAAVAQDSAGVAVSYEVSRDRFRYHFKDPSTFDTPELVPHDFTQTYWGDNKWGVVRARYRLGRRLLSSEVAASPQRTTRGDDFDTFFQPGGDIVISGTTGNVSLRSIRVRQDIALGPAMGVDWRIGYQFRRDRSRFHIGQTKIVSHSIPASRDVLTVFGRETTTSNVHEVRFGVTRQWRRGAWHAAVDVDVAPTTRATLTTILPDKYPGREIVYTAIAFSLHPAFTLTRGTRWPIFLTVDAARTFSYVDSRQFTRNALSVGVGAGWAFR